MTYKVHRLEVKEELMQQLLEDFLNSLRGEVVAIIPNITPVFRPMGATSKVNFLLIVERIT